jgi:hypothetical protein
MTYEVRTSTNHNEEVYMEVTTASNSTYSIDNQAVAIKRGLDYLRNLPVSKIGKEKLLLEPNLRLDSVAQGKIQASIIIVTEGAAELDMRDRSSLALRLRQIKGIDIISDHIFHPEAIHRVAMMKIWRYKFTCAMDTELEYLFNGKVYQATAPSANSVDCAIFSCNGRQTVAEQEELERHGGLEQFWANIHNSHKKESINLLIGLGDQIYNDDIFENLPDFINFQKLPVKEKINAEFTEEMRHDLEEYLLRKYCNHFSKPEFQAMLAKTFKIFSWDDHDIRDGNGSYDENLQNSPVFRGVFEVAFQMYCLLQHHMTEEEQEDREGLFGSVGINQMFHFGEISMLNLDTRTERTREQIISDDTLAAMCEELAKIPTGTRHLFVLLGVPLVYPDLTIGDAMLEQMNTLQMHLHPNKTMPTELRDDLNDHWNNPLHNEERDRFIRIFFALANEKGIRVTLLSGDVHIGALGMLRGEEDDLTRDPGYMMNLITSPIGNRPGAVLKYPLKLLSAAQNLNGGRKVGDQQSYMINYELEGRKEPKTPDFIPWNNWIRTKMNQENGGINCDLYAIKPEEQDPSNSIFAKMGRAFATVGLRVREWWNTEKIAANAAVVHKIYHTYVPPLQLERI